MKMRWLHAKNHPTWHFTAMCLGVLAGVAGVRWLPYGMGGIPLLFAGGLLALLWLARPRRFMIMAALVAGVCFGLWRGGVGQASLQQYSQLYDQHVRLVGRVADDVDTNGRNQLVVKLRDITMEGRRLSGELWVTVGAHNVTLKRSDRVEVDGKLLPSFGSYSGTILGATLIGVTREQNGDVALSVRDGFAGRVRAAIDEPAASLGVGYLLGQKSALPASLVEALSVVGLTHIVVASGYNLTILVRFARRWLVRTSKFLASFAGLSLVGGFIAITGASPSMVRAGLVAGFAMVAWYYGRKFHPVTLLLFVGAITVMANPSYAWGNLGWALSFAAFAGVMIVAPLLQAYFYGNEKPALVPQLLGETIAAQLATAPIILVAFGQFSNIAVLSNLLILPFIPLAMLLTFAAGIGAYGMPAWANVIGWPAEQLLAAMIWVIERTADVSWAQSTLEFPVWAAAIWYGLLALVCGYVKWRTGYRLHDASIVE